MAMKTTITKTTMTTKIDDNVNSLFQERGRSGDSNYPNIRDQRISTMDACSRSRGRAEIREFAGERRAYQVEVHLAPEALPVLELNTNPEEEIISRLESQGCWLWNSYEVYQFRSLHPL